MVGGARPLPRGHAPRHESPGPPRASTRASRGPLCALALATWAFQARKSSASDLLCAYMQRSPNRHGPGFSQSVDVACGERAGAHMR